MHPYINNPTIVNLIFGPQCTQFSAIMIIGNFNDGQQDRNAQPEAISLYSATMSEN